jgi:hypothetical protein
MPRPFDPEDTVMFAQETNSWLVRLCSPARTRLQFVGFRTGAASIVVPILAGLSLAGCGGAGGPFAAVRAGVSRQAVSRHPYPITRSFTKAQATAFAHAVNLTSADLPRFTGSPMEAESSESDQQSHALLQCTGSADPHPLVAEASSEELERADPEHQETFYSRVAVLSTAALAAKELAEIRSSQGEQCVERQLKELIEGGGEAANYSLVSMVEHPLEVPGLPGGYELEVIMHATDGERSLYGYMDILGFFDGPVEVTLTAGRIQEPISPVTEQRLISVLFKRTQAYGTRLQ